MNLDDRRTMKNTVIYIMCDYCMRLSSIPKNGSQVLPAAENSPVFPIGSP